MEVTKWLKPSISVSRGDHQITLIHINYVGCRILALPFRSFRDANTLYHLKGQRLTRIPRRNMNVLLRRCALEGPQCPP